MIAYLKGVLLDKSAASVIIDVQGVGYRVQVAPITLAELPAKENKIALHTSLVVRENSQTLYGFIKPDERDLFEVLIEVSGIGPKTGLSIIGHLSFSQLQSAVSDYDVKVISQVPGVGKKTAERLIIDLKDKLPKFFDHAIVLPKGIGADVVAALITLGYPLAKAQKASEATLKAHPNEKNLSKLITVSLMHCK